MPRPKPIKRLPQAERIRRHLEAFDRGEHYVDLTSPNIQEQLRTIRQIHAFRATQVTRPPKEIIFPEFQVDLPPDDSEE